MITVLEKIKKIGYTILGFTLLYPKLVSAQIFVPIVPKCEGAFGSSQEVDAEICGWNDLVEMGQNIIQDAVVLVAILAVLSITYAGYLYATAGGNDSQIKQAHKVFEKVIWGIFLTLGAWLIVYSLLDWLDVSDNFKK